MLEIIYSYIKNAPAVSEKKLSLQLTKITLENII
jgi:hypothetical protein